MARFAWTVLLGLLVAAPAFAGEGWVDDYDKAVEKAKAEGKDLLVDFTGSDWCGWCIKLHDEVFQHEETFLTHARKQYVLVALDFPKNPEIKAKVPNPERNEELRKKLGVGGFPTILLMNVDGDVFGRAGYKPGGPEKYWDHLTELRASGKAALAKYKAMIAAYRGESDAARKAAALGAMADDFASMESGAIGAGMLARELRVVLNQEDAALKTKVLRGYLKQGTLDAAVKKAALEIDPKNEHGLREQLVLAELKGAQSAAQADAAIQAFGELPSYKDKKQCSVWCAQIALFFQHRKKDTDTARVWRAMDNGLEDERLSTMLAQLLGEEEEPEEKPESEGDDEGGGK